jgi:GNAT superfamily N-acetyltransferase
VEAPSDLEFDAPSADTAAADRDLWGLYAESMPAEEREPPRVIVASVAAGDAVLTRARRAATGTVGFAVTHLLKQPPAAFLVYLAVAKQERGGGIGSQLFEYAWSTAERAAAERGRDLLGVTWEIDDPDRAPNVAEREHRVRRRNFFAHLGGAPLGVAYLQPPVNGPAPVPMRLMWRGKQGRATPDIHALVRAIYFEKYGAANGVRKATLDRLLEQVLAT